MNLKKFSFLLCFCWFLLFILIIVSSVESPLEPNFSSKKTVFTFFPQGWGFFTRNPREKIIKLYKVDNEGKVISLIKSNSAREFYFGISKKNRLVNWEISTLIPKIPKTNWIKNQKDSLFFSKNKAKDTIINDFVKPSLRGTYIVVIQERIPQAWGEYYKKIVMPYDYAKVYIK